ncbi:hypothetical protein TrVE_jg13189 [Triparma verrucosa]|uniref:Alpha/beta hydrolase fold-3 domain-containing protein n=1 Tax=Triparma verrucosa TaxID=1606542 RepID=A0A9W7ET91_9STRA|nr:hypothetical protein TrVE_jg13189 [Triparma verrucosa]
MTDTITILATLAAAAAALTGFYLYGTRLSSSPPPLLTFLQTYFTPLLILLVRTNQKVMCTIFGHSYAQILKHVDCTVIKLYTSILQRLHLYTFSDPKNPDIKYFSLLPPSQVKDSPTIFYIHGGGHTVHTATETLITLAFSTFKQKNYKFYHADYPLCPTSPLSSNISHLWSLYKTVHSLSSGSIILMGDSAGGHSSLLLKLKTLSENKYKPKGTVLISPWLSVINPGRVPTFKGKDNDYMDPKAVDAFRYNVMEGGGAISNVDDIIKECIERGGVEETLILSGGGELMHLEAVALYLANGGSEIYTADEGPHDFCVSRAFCKPGVYEECWGIVEEKLNLWLNDWTQIDAQDFEVDIDDEVDEDEEGSEGYDEGEEEEEEVEGDYEEVKLYVDMLRAEVKGQQASEEKKKKEKKTAKKSAAPAKRRTRGKSRNKD